MIIPKSLKIAGHRVSVVQVDGSDLEMPEGKEVFLGLSIAMANKIILLNRLQDLQFPEDIVAETFLHEIIHIVEQNAGLELTEGQVNALASGLYQVLKDNKLVFN